jgi:hypothetical protein
VAGTNLAQAIARNASVLPREQAMLMSDWTFMQAAILIEKLLWRIDAGERRNDVARTIVRDAQTLPFAFECFRWLRSDPDEPAEPRLVTEEVENELGRSLANRISRRGAEVSIYEEYGTDSPRLFYAWNKYGNPDDIQAYLAARFNTDARECLKFLGTFVGRAWGIESGLSRPSDFDRDNYNAVIKYISADTILEKLREMFGNVLDDPQYHHSDQTPFETRLAYQFSFVHKSVVNQEQNSAQEGSG